MAGIQVRPTFIPNDFRPNPTIAQSLAPGAGALGGKLFAALLAQMGAAPTQGQFTSPTGASAQISPAEVGATSGVPLATSLQGLQGQGNLPGSFQAQGFRGLLGQAFPQDPSGQQGVADLALTKARTANELAQAQFTGSPLGPGGGEVSPAATPGAGVADLTFGDLSEDENEERTIELIGLMQILSDDSDPELQQNAYERLLELNALPEDFGDFNATQ